MDTNKNTYQNEECYRISNFYTAAFLYTKGMELVDINRDPLMPKRFQFVFKDITEREILIHNFNFAKEDSSEVMVDARKFVTAIKTLKDKLYQEKY